MKLEDFKIGDTFFANAGFQWLCTDKGTRTINAIMLDPEQEDYWFKGPPYAVDEVIFDEYDMQSCYLSYDDILLDTDLEDSLHPNFSSEDVKKMSKELQNRYQYHRKNLMKKDRVGNNGEILHPYSAVREDSGWHVKTFELFSRQYSQMHENDFAQLSLSDAQAMKNRKDKFNKE